MAFPDLTDLATVTGYLAERGLTPAELAALPMLITSASDNIRLYCRRAFTSWTFDELYTVDPPEREITLRQFPVLAVESVRTDPSVVLTIANTSTANQRAIVGLATGGDVETSPAPTGITLTRWASGVKSSQTLTFAANVTLTALATAIAGLGNGWTATPALGYELWPSSDLRAVQGGSATNGNAVQLLMHLSDLSCDIDERMGILTLGTDTNASANTPRWGPTWSQEFQDVSAYGGTNGVRVVYTAGFNVVPSDVQKAVADTCQSALDRLKTDMSIQSESDGTISWTGRDPGKLTALPLSVCTAMSMRVNHRA